LIEKIRQLLVSGFHRLGGSRSGQQREVVSSSISCDSCGEPAATLRYIPRGLTHPSAGPASQSSNRLVVDGFLGTLTAVVSRRPDRVSRAVAEADPEALWGIDDLWAPFYCPECRKSFCEGHWTTEVVFADDSPGWYEHTSGRCPHGHRRLLDD
jgi:hypothetical protein